MESGGFRVQCAQCKMDLTLKRSGNFPPKRLVHAIGCQKATSQQSPCNCNYLKIKPYLCSRCGHRSTIDEHIRRIHWLAKLKPTVTLQDNQLQGSTPLPLSRPRGVEQWRTRPDAFRQGQTRLPLVKCMLSHLLSSMSHQTMLCPSCPSPFPPATLPSHLVTCHIGLRTPLWHCDVCDFRAAELGAVIGHGLLEGHGVGVGYSLRCRLASNRPLQALFSALHNTINQSSLDESSEEESDNTKPGIAFEELTEQSLACERSEKPKSQPRPEMVVITEDLADTNPTASDETNKEPGVTLINEDSSNKNLNKSGAAMEIRTSNELIDQNAMDTSISRPIKMVPRDTLATKASNKTVNLSQILETNRKTPMKPVGVSEETDSLATTMKQSTSSHGSDHVAGEKTMSSGGTETGDETESEGFRVQCVQCKREITSKRSRSVGPGAIGHAIGCQKIKPYLCGGCGHRSTQRSIINDHIRRIHWLAKPKPTVTLLDKEENDERVREALEFCFPGISAVWKGFQ